MNYQQALDFINRSAKFGNKPGLERIKMLLGALGDPHKRLKFVHVAGTNGKGSTCAMTESILRAAGYKVGMYISPYLEDYCERIQINRQLIPRDTLAAYVTEAEEHIQRLVTAGAEHATKFEIETAIGMKYFADQGCDIVVLEVGLGGRLDATNIIESAEVCVITSISHDHTQILGNKLEEIAFEKCGILKRGSAAVSCVMQHPDAAAVIERRCRETLVPLNRPIEAALKVENADLTGSRIVYRNERYTVPLIGAHQIQNALIAIEIANTLNTRGWKIPQSAVTSGIASTRWNGRLEIICEKPLCIIDGAHNQDAMAVLCGVIDSLLVRRHIITVMAMSEEKRHDLCAPMIARRSSYFIATRADGAPHPLPPEALAVTLFGRGIRNEVIPNVKQAIARAMSIAKPDDVILVCGSLYMIGEAKAALLQWR